jgi:hypothetical protein
MRFSFSCRPLFGERMIDVMGSTLPFGEIVEAALEQQLGKLGYLEIHWTIGAFPNDPGASEPGARTDVGR